MQEKSVSEGFHVHFFTCRNRASLRSCTCGFSRAGKECHTQRKQPFRIMGCGENTCMTKAFAQEQWRRTFGRLPYKRFSPMNGKMRHNKHLFHDVCTLPCAQCGKASWPGTLTGYGMCYSCHCRCTGQEEYWKAMLQQHELLLTQAGVAYTHGYREPVPADARVQGIFYSSYQR